VSEKIAAGEMSDSALRRCGFSLFSVQLWITLPDKPTMSPDAETKRSGQDGEGTGFPLAPNDRPSLRTVPLTTIGLCGLGMILLGSQMRRAAAAGWGLALAIAGMLILILFMGMVQERWLTRERHRLIVSALKRTGARPHQARSGGRSSRRASPRRGGKSKADE
jgi:hypothetical protein